MPYGPAPATAPQAAVESQSVAAFYGNHADDDDGASRTFLNRWRWASTVSAICPSCGRSRPVFGIITHLKDKHRWTREWIATWVAGIEPTNLFPGPHGGKVGAWRPSITVGCADQSVGEELAA